MSNFEKYNNVFCDSKEALEWAYENGLSKDALIRTSSPALLLNRNEYNIEHIEKRWSSSEMREYQTSINDFVKSIYREVIGIDSISHEIALAVSVLTLEFHTKLFKAACLKESDLINPRLIIQIESAGNGLNNINPPFDQLLANNKNIRVSKYTPIHDKWGGLTTKGLSWFQRYKIAGIETIIFRIAVKLYSHIPDYLIKRKVIIPSENELVIEIAASLALKGVALKTTDHLSLDNSLGENSCLVTPIWEKIQPIVSKRLKKWVVFGLIERCEEMLFSDILEKLNNIESWKVSFDPYLKKEGKNKKIIVLSNTLIKDKGFAIVGCCQKYNIPVISTQHGVTYEICATHDEMSAMHEVNLSDRLIVYNNESKISAERTGFFHHSKIYISGISLRHRRVQSNSIVKNKKESIVFVSANLYKGNIGLFSTWDTDFDRAKKECALINLVFSKLPYTVCYKIYPEENRRYVDRDPALRLAGSYENIEIYDKKIDMRYLIKQYRIFVTTKATSTLSWLVMSGKPLVFINARNNMPLTEDAYKDFSKGLFLFDDSEHGFYENLIKFLSQPIENIEKLWEEKKIDRSLMVQRYFNSSTLKAGRRSADMIYGEYL